MGAWGTEPWSSDGAADWFAGFFEGINADAKITAAFAYTDDYDAIRAACWVLQKLGRPMIWPGDLDTLDGFLAEGIGLLTAMIDPDTDEGEEFLELWDNDASVIESVRDQIRELEMLRMPPTEAG
ncbi:hypothetical protein ASE14_11960 [Agromyces sp. Root81]|uniref:hypothetical protein n=1 Tax=Agromyces sp. Root81 TaxID=1736601 RepID=UPI0006FD2064|nr:hypothetical protein [Agromyces sp. Root81]KRC61555.1 hypothetical protein ASE14_11960 [Agromyces sp. Root81]